MQWYEYIFELIDMRSFSNLWFWIALAVVWSLASHWVMGVPYDLILRARRKKGRAQEDMEQLARINAARLINIADVAGYWLVGIVTCALTILGVLGFVYRIEFCQAVFLLAFPMSAVSMLSIRTARIVLSHEGEGDALLRRLRRHRFSVQLIGMVAIFVTALWGMWQNMNASALWG